MNAVGGADDDAVILAERVLSAVMEEELVAYDDVAAVDRDARRWYVRINGVDREFVTIWVTLRERMLHFECYFMPAPKENAEAVWEYLLRLNGRLVGVHFAIGGEDAVYVMGQLPVTAVTEDALDRLLGTVYHTVETHFRSAMRLGYPGVFA